jgi:hypothetical protein
MTKKKTVTEPVVDETVVDEIDEVVETVVEPVKPTEFVEPSSAVRDRIVTLIRRRGPVGDFQDIVQIFLRDSEMPSDEDGWIKFANSLER